MRGVGLFNGDRMFPVPGFGTNVRVQWIAGMSSGCSYMRKAHCQSKRCRLTNGDVGFESQGLSGG